MTLDPIAIFWLNLGLIWFGLIVVNVGQDTKDRELVGLGFGWIIIGLVVVSILIINNIFTHIHIEYIP